MRNLKRIALLLMTICLGGMTWGQTRDSGNANLGTLANGISGKTIEASELTKNRTWYLAGNNTISGCIQIKTFTLTIQLASNATADCILNLTENGRFSMSTGRLVIQGAEGKQIIIDGGAKWSTYSGSDDRMLAIQQNNIHTGGAKYDGSGSVTHTNPMIKVSTSAESGGGFDFDYVTLRNYVNTSTDDGQAQGGFFVARGSSSAMTMDHCIIEDGHCRAYGGTAFYLRSCGNGHYHSDGLVLNDCIIRSCSMDGYYVSNGNNEYASGVIRTNGGSYLNVTLNDCTIEKCFSSNVGGLVHWNVKPDNGHCITINDCTCRNNVAFKNGGALFNEGKMVVNRCTFEYNKALNGRGGAIIYQVYSQFTGSNGSSHLSLDANTVIRYNEAVDGGGLSLEMVKCKDLQSGDYQIDLEVNGTTITHNKATGDGGGIYFVRFIDDTHYKGSIVINSGNISNNEATGTSGANKGNGGAICLTHGISATIKGGTINDNSAARYGGAIYMAGQSGYRDALTIDQESRQSVAIGQEGHPNHADGYGGGIYVGSYSDVTIKSGSISYNTSGNNGGGIYLRTDAVMNISGTASITGNETTGASTKGGGIYVGGTLNLGDGSLTVMENHCNNHLVKSNIYLPSDKYLNITNANFNPNEIGIYAENTADYFQVMYCELSGYSNILDGIYNGVAGGTMNIFDDKQLYSIFHGTAWGTYTGLNAKYLYFVKTPWSALQQQTTTADLTKISGTDIYDIKDIKSLTAFMWKVNAIELYEDQTPGNDIAGKLTADISMVGQYWVPIGTSTTNFVGTFDGNGHVISDLTMVSANANHDYGMFGHVGTGADIKNVVLKDCLFTGDNSASYAGSLVSQMNGGSLSNCQAHGIVNTAAATCTIGGLVGLADGGEIHSCYSAIELAGYNMGGLVGELASGSNLKNNFTNPKFGYIGSDNTYKIGGLVATNAGTTANCYVREMSGSSHGSATYGTLVGSNTGTVSHCFCMTGTTPGNNVGSDCGTYTAVVSGDSYQYKTHDCLANSQPLQRELNSWVNSQTGTTRYAKWDRPTTKVINGDYPLLRLGYANAVTATSGDTFLGYGDINDLMRDNTSSGQAIFMYGSKVGMESNSGSSASLFVGEDAAFTQTTSKAGAITGTAEIYLDNSAGANGANPQSGGSDAIDWHFFSTPLSNAPLGVDYNGNNTNYGYFAEIPHFSQTGLGYYPTGVNGDNYDEWDFYCYYEPDYHWINFKRNGPSHYHEDYPEWHIDYKATPSATENVNESTLVKGKGYMIALAEETLLQCTGTFTDGNVGLAMTKDGVYRTGLNLLGNPYQSWLDFEDFADGNSTIWGDETPYYIIMDEDQRNYVLYTRGQSPNAMTAGRYLHPHQGFMVVTAAATTAQFTNDMRETGVDSKTSPFRGEQIAYPLVNLIVSDENGNRNLATAELGRPDKGGSEYKSYNTLAKGALYVHYDDKDYHCAFTEPGITTLPVRFEAFEEGEFTITWDMENGEFSYVHLIDNITGADIDMLATDEYTITGKPSDLRSRFKLVFEYTGIEEDENAVVNASFAYMNDGQLVVEGEGDLQLIDLNGRVLRQTRLTGAQSTVSLPEMAKGLYILKLNDRTQKIVL